MDISYFERRLQAELRAVETAAHSCAKTAHQQLADAYHARLALLRWHSPGPPARDFASRRKAEPTDGRPLPEPS